MKIYFQFLILIYLYFVIGGIGIYFIARKDSLEGKKRRWIKYFVYLLLVHLTFFCIIGPYYLFPIFLGLVFLTGLWEIINTGKKSGFKILAPAILLYFLIGLSILNNMPFPTEEILWFYALIIVFDGFSQIAGQLMGRTKITPEISPNKTLEGFLGGFVMTILTAFITRHWLHYPNIQVFILAMGVCISAFAGDILASLYKRRVGIKDFSNLIPGHGGILDRYDSFLFALAMYPFVRALALIC